MILQPSANTGWRSGAAALLAAMLLLPVGCSKSRGPEGDAGTGTNPAAGNPPATSPGAAPGGRDALATSNTVLFVSTNDDRTTATPVQEPAQRVAALQGQYRAAQAFDDRFEAAIRLGEVGTAEAVAGLEELFRAEPNKELRVELINALIGIGGCKEERLRFLKLGVGADQPFEVREAAMDGLVDLEDARALALLKGLSEDPDEKVRALARQSRDLLEQMLK
jgi:hypothetical protein